MGYPEGSYEWQIQGDFWSYSQGDGLHLYRQIDDIVIVPVYF